MSDRLVLSQSNYLVSVVEKPRLKPLSPASCQTWEATWARLLLGWTCCWIFTTSMGLMTKALTVPATMPFLVMSVTVLFPRFLLIIPYTPKVTALVRATVQSGV